MKIILLISAFASLAFGWSYTFNPKILHDAFDYSFETEDTAPDGCHEDSSRKSASNDGEDDDENATDSEGKICVLEADTPSSIAEVHGGKSLTKSRSWRPPEYQKQGAALGYADSPFAIPKGLQVAVEFWTDIYTKYTTNQGAIHDTEYLNIVYEDVDFSDIMRNQNFSRHQKARARTKRVKAMKKEIQEILTKLDKIPDTPEGLSQLNPKEKKIWQLFSAIDEKNKFKAAASKDRVRFQLGQKDKIESAIFYSGRYLEGMERMFKEMNLPIELTRLAFVESSFNVLARSKVGASGIWQIMPYVARRKITSALDWRNHPMEATRIAANMLKANYQMLESWPLAVTGYNHGPTGVSKLVKKYKTRDISDLVANVRGSRTFGFASRNFYACFLAMIQIEKDALKYFPNATWSEKLRDAEVVVPRDVTYKEVLSWFDDNDEMVQIYNPQIAPKARAGKVKIPAKTKLWVHQDKIQNLLALFDGNAESLAMNLRKPGSNIDIDSTKESKRSAYIPARAFYYEPHSFNLIWLTDDAKPDSLLMEKTTTNPNAP